MDRRSGQALTTLSALGYPISQFAIRRCGRTGAAVVQVVCVGLLARDATLLGRGTARILRAGPAMLLWSEAVAAAVAAGTNARLLVTGSATPASDRVRRAALAALFGLHTLRFHIYLGPGQGRRTSVMDGEQHDAARR